MSVKNVVLIHTTVQVNQSGSVCYAVNKERYVEQTFINNPAKHHGTLQGSSQERIKKPLKKKKKQGEERNDRKIVFTKY